MAVAGRTAPRDPAYNWWNEALHGVARAGEATVFPQAIGGRGQVTYGEDLFLTARLASAQRLRGAPITPRNTAPSAYPPDGSAQPCQAGDERGRRRASQSRAPPAAAASASRSGSGTHTVAVPSSRRASRSPVSRAPSA